jgi:hypothetical protein
VLNQDRRVDELPVCGIVGELDRRLNDKTVHQVVFRGLGRRGVARGIREWEKSNQTLLNTWDTPLYYVPCYHRRRGPLFRYIIIYRSNQEVCTSQKYVTYDVVFALPVAGPGVGGLT